MYFPEIWKKQQLVLISKGKEMLDTSGKLLERLLKPRFIAAIENGEGLSTRQYGFRSSRSTISALREWKPIYVACDTARDFGRKK